MTVTPLTSEPNDAARLTAITSQQMFWDGAIATAANGGNRVKLFAPPAYESGSTYSLIDTSAPESMVRQAVPDNGVFRTFNTVELAMLRDMGYMTVPEPSSFSSWRSLVFQLAGFSSSRNWPTFDFRESDRGSV